MRIVPETTINLYKDVTIDNGEQIVFTSRSAQTAYFNSKLLRSNINCTVVKTKSGSLRLEVPGSVVAQCNYLSFINPHFDNKTIYCKILDYNYINNECVEISYAIDAWQTWCFDVTFDECFIEREHISENDYNKLENGTGYDTSVPEMMTPEPLAYGEGIEVLKGKIYNAEYSGIDEETDQNYGHSLFFEQTPQRYVDILFMAPINWEEFDEANPQMYENDIWHEWDVSNTSVAFDMWLKTQIETDPENYSYKKPSQLIKAFKSLLSGQSHYAIYDYTKHAWTYNLGSGVHTYAGNSNMAQPYDVYIIPHGLSYGTNKGTYTDELIRIYTQMGAVSSILGMFSINYDLIDDYFNNQGVGGKSHTVKTSKGRMNDGLMSTVESHKLLWHPYCYMTLEDSDGNQKELKYEELNYNSASGEATTIKTFLDLNTQPCLVASPMGKFTHCDSGGNRTSYNVKDSMVVDAFPQMPYATDQYLAFVAESAKSIIGTNYTAAGGRAMAQRQQEIELSNQQLIGGIDEATFGVINSAASFANSLVTAGGQLRQGDIFGALTSLGSGGYNTIAGTLQASANATRTQETQNIQRRMQNADLSEMRGATGALAGEQNALTKSLAGTKPAYAANMYHAGSRGGLLHYLKGLDPIDIYVRYHQPTAAILEKYDNYFKMYGYKSGRCGMPRVINYMKGSGDAPHWVTVGSKQTTYIQTSSMKVTHVMQPVADAIKAMFDGGVRFIKGN